MKDRWSFSLYFLYLSCQSRTDYTSLLHFLHINTLAMISKIFFQTSVSINSNPLNVFSIAIFLYCFSSLIGVYFNSFLNWILSHSFSKLYEWKATLTRSFFIMKWSNRLFCIQIFTDICIWGVFHTEVIE